MQGMWVRSLGLEDPLEKETATHSNILAWEIPRTEEPGGLQSMGVAKSQTRLKQLNNKSLCVFLLEVLFLFLKGRMECRTIYEA